MALIKRDRCHIEWREAMVTHGLTHGTLWTMPYLKTYDYGY